MQARGRIPRACFVERRGAATLPLSFDSALSPLARHVPGGWFRTRGDQRSLNFLRAELVTGNFLAVARVEPVMCDDWMIPSLTAEDLEPAQLFVFIRLSGNQHAGTILRHHKQ